MIKRYLLAGLLLNSISLHAQEPVVAGYLGRFEGQFAPVLINQQKQWLHVSGAVLVDKTENTGYYNTVVAVKHNAYGAINNAGKIIAPFKYDEVTLADEQDNNDSTKNYCFVITRLNGKYGAADTLGNIICPPIYAEVSALTPHVLKMKKDGRWGWIDIKTGKVLQEPIYEEAGKSYALKNAIEITKAGKVGLAAEDGTIIVPAGYESFDYLGGNSTYFGFTANGKTGIMDQNGKVIIPAVYDKCKPGPATTLFAVEKNGKTGLVDAGGKTLLPFQYTGTGLTGNVMKVSIGDKYGVVNTEGKEIIPPRYSDIKAINAAGQEVFDGGVISAPGQAKDRVSPVPVVFLVSDATGTGLFDANGKSLLPLTYSRITPFSWQDTTFLAAEKNGKTGVLGMDGKIILPVAYDGLVNGFGSGFSYVDDNAGESKKDYLPIVKGEKIGLVNITTGKEIIPAQYEWLQWQNSRMLLLRKGDTTSLADVTGKILRGGKRYGFFTAVDTNRIVEMQYNDDGSSTSLLTDLAGNTLYTSQRWEFKENQVSRLLMPESEKGSNARFNNGLLKLWSNARNNVFLDPNGKEVVFDGYSFVGDFWNDLALAGIDSTPQHTLYGIINRRKEIIYPVTADDIYAMNNLLVVKKGDRKGLITKEGKTLLPVAYEEIDDIYDAPFFKVSRNNKYGVADSLGKIILPVEFDDISYRKDERLFQVTRTGKYGIADASGKMIIPAIYDNMDVNQGYDKNIFPILVQEGKWYFYLDAQGKAFPYKSLKKKGYDD
ncbi:hypothetical protein QFZ48_005206 [Chitinophaga sp. W2I13]|uniref:WG repeat-containing protein n=1 Tax=Chitinophaga sp. W2I13 TaxID=3373923 RepID=UPI003D19A9F2